jgi:hypothetical protein
MIEFEIHTLGHSLAFITELEAQLDALYRAPESRHAPSPPHAMSSAQTALTLLVAQTKIAGLKDMHRQASRVFCGAGVCQLARGEDPRHV